MNQQKYFTWDTRLNWGVLHSNCWRVYFFHASHWYSINRSILFASQLPCWNLFKILQPNIVFQLLFLLQKRSTITRPDHTYQQWLPEMTSLIFFICFLVLELAYAAGVSKSTRKERTCERVPNVSTPPLPLSYSPLPTSPIVCSPQARARLLAHLLLPSAWKNQKKRGASTQAVLKCLYKDKQTLT